MKRFAHRIKGNKTVELPHSCFWFDTETKPFQIAPGETGQKLWFGWACHQYTKGGGTWVNPKWLRFVDAPSFLQWIESRTREKTRSYVFGHNLHFESTVLNLSYHMPKMGWEISRAIVESPPFILGWRKGNKTIEFLDTGNWWLHSLAKIGESIGIPKLPFPDRVETMEVWDEYCKNDVEVIRKACLYWFEFIKRYDLGGFARTLAGQSYKAFRHRFMKHEIFIDDHERAMELGRSAYHGGRTECFFIGKLKGPVYCFDVNSMYPFVMANNPYPVKKITYGRVPTVGDLRKWVDEYSIVADVEIETDEPLYALLHNHKIVFPVGRFRLALTTPDIRTAIAKGHIKRTFAFAAYEQEFIFSRFVNEIYRLRQAAQKSGDDVMTYNLKILLNSLYGKFGQAGRVWELIERVDDLNVEVWEEIDAVTGILYSWRKFGGIIQCKQQHAESYESFPAIAAHVTAFSRALLWKLFLKAGLENVFYCDTDSLFVNEAGKRRLTSICDRTRLGALKLEKVFDWLTVYGAKDYQSSKGRVCKGVKAKATWIDDSTVRQEEWKKLPGLLRRGVIDSPIIVEKVKHLSRVYDKGIVTPSGWVEPLRFGDGSGDGRNN